MELSNYSRKKDGETNNINSATTPVEKTKKNVTVWFFPTKEAKEVASLSLYKKDWRTFYSSRVLRNFGGEDREFCETIFAKYSILDTWQGSELPPTNSMFCRINVHSVEFLYLRSSKTLCKNTKWNTIPFSSNPVILFHVLLSPLRFYWWEERTQY